MAPMNPMNDKVWVLRMIVSRPSLPPGIIMENPEGWKEHSHFLYLAAAEACASRFPSALMKFR